MAKEGAYAVLYILLLKFQEMLDAYTNFPLLVQLARKISVYFCSPPFPDPHLADCARFGLASSQPQKVSSLILRPLT